MRMHNFCSNYYIIVACGYQFVVPVIICSERKM